jgi:methylase of polypeptide subunit release factors
VLVMEIGMGQAKAVTGVLTAAGLGAELTLRHDLQGIPRVAVAQRP